MAIPDTLVQWFYDRAFPMLIHLDNISGATDIAGSVAVGNPLRHVYSTSGCQWFCLGTPVKVYDTTIEGGIGVKGREVEDGVPGDSSPL